MARLSFQLYSARKFDLATILPHLASIGLTELEGYCGLYDDLTTRNDSTIRQYDYKRRDVLLTVNYHLTD